MKKLKAYGRIALTLAAVIVVMNALAFVPGVADDYADRVYGLVTEPLSRLCAHVTLPVGELLMYAAAALVLIAIVLALLLIPLHGRRGFATGCKRYFKGLLIVLLAGLLLYTLNWVIPFRATPLSAQYAGNEYTLEDLEQLRASMVAGMNEAAADSPRGEGGMLQHSDSVDEAVFAAMQGLAAHYPRLAGYYPAAKPALCSDVLEWMRIGGYTYPYTMEVTYNRHISKLYYPVLLAHESAHHKGHYLESEAEFLAFLGCSQSDDAIVRYSGYESAYYYVEDAYVRTLVELCGEDGARERYAAQPQLSAQVRADLAWDAEQRQLAYEESVNQRAEEAFSGLAGDVAERGWSTQDQILQAENYSGMVQLLLGWYCG